MGTKATGNPPEAWSLPIPRISNDSMMIVPAVAERICRLKKHIELRMETLYDELVEDIKYQQGYPFSGSLVDMEGHRHDSYP
jgi:hypothetical protein